MTNKELMEFLKKYPEDQKVGIFAAWPERNAILQHGGLFIFGGKQAPILGVEVNGQVPMVDKQAEEAMDAMKAGEALPLAFFNRENKQTICDWFTAALVHTRQCRDLMLLTYEKNEETQEETVTAHFPGETVKINVTIDSGIAMMKDILRALS